MATTRKTMQQRVDEAVAERLEQVKAQAIAEATAKSKDAQQGLVLAESKPDLINNLKATWRQTAEHKAAQVKLFLSTLGGLLAMQVVSDVVAGKTPFTTVHDVRSLWYYVLPVALVAWRQRHPALTAEALDKADGATIVPEQVGAPTVEVPVEEATVQMPIDTPQGDAVGEGDAAP